MAQDLRRSATMIVAAAAAVCSTALAGASGAAAGTPLASGARAAAVGGTWGTAREVPGTAALNRGGDAELSSVSCASAGNCSAGGTYTDSSGRTQVYVAGETNGTWHTAIELTGTAALNRGGAAEFLSVSCASAGNCSAGGTYADSSGRTQVFVAGETNGTWHTAIEVPGAAALNRGGDARVTSISCASAGDCSAGGFYTDSHARFHAFVAGETNGTWHTAIELPGSATLNRGGDARVTSISCASAGNCGAAGFYRDSSGHYQAFVAAEANGTWRNAVKVPGIATLNQDGNPQVHSVLLSCGSAGNCTAGGEYVDGSGRQQAFVASETNGTLHAAVEVPGTAALNQGDAVVLSVSCASAGNCSAGGTYQRTAPFRQQVFVADETNGTWHIATEVPGTAALNQGGNAVVSAVSCHSAGTCSAGGFYTDSSGRFQAFVAGETNGTWGKAIEVPGTATTLNQGRGAQVNSVSCGSASNCSAGGTYTDSSRHRQAFVVNET